MSKSEKLIKKQKELLKELELHLLENRKDFEVRSIVFSLRGTRIGREVQTEMREHTRQEHREKQNVIIEMKDDQDGENEETPVVFDMYKRSVLESFSLRQLKEIARDDFGISGRKMSRKKKKDIIQMILDAQLNGVQNEKSEEKETIEQ